MTVEPVDQARRFLGNMEQQENGGEFIALNAVGLLVTAALAFPSVRSRSKMLGLGLLAWLSFLMLANGVMHLAASIQFREYVPGVVSAVVLYLPYYAVASRTICRSFDIRPHIAVLTAAIGAAPMVAHGISILTVGRPLLW